MTGSVAIVGAGPTGLTLACMLAEQGVPTTVLDRRSNPAGPSKAIVLWSRTLEVFDEFGIVDDIRERGVAMTAARYTSGRRTITMRTGDIPGTAQPPVILPQHITESLLHKRFAALGGEIRWGTEITALNQDDDAATLTTGTGERIDADYVVGCDGLHSTVRRCAGVGWQGSAFEEAFQLGDVTATVPLDRDGAHHFLGRDGFVILVPLPDGNWRIVGSGPDVQDHRPTMDELQRLVHAYGPRDVIVHAVDWSDVFRITRRLAAELRTGRVFLAGDAAHVHSPAGGQGLNTGVQDAHNLAWKLAFVLRYGADPALLDSYPTERRPVAEQVVKITDLQAKYLFLARSPLARIARNVVLRGMSRNQHRLLPTIAQLTVDYADSPLTRGTDGTRMPELAAPGRITVLDAPGVRSVVEPFGGVVRVSRAQRAELLAIRPDGHVGFTGHLYELTALRSWLADTLRLPVLERSR